MNKITFVVAALAFAAFASAEKYSDFFTADAMTGITITNVGNTFTITLSDHPTITYHGVTREVEAVHGLWALSTTSDLDAAASNQNGWKFEQNQKLKDGGWIAGWEDGHKHAVGESQS